MFAKLMDIWKKERVNNQLQVLKPDFYTELKNFIEKLNEDEKTLDQNTLKGKLLKNEIRRVKKIASELLETRFHKILKAIIEDRSISLEILTKEEELTYEKIIEGFQFFENLNKKISNDRKINEKNSVHTIDKSKILIRLLKDVPLIIGIDMRSYGPFKKEDMASLPATNAELLISRDAAVKVEINGV